MTSRTNPPSPLSPAERALMASLDPPDFRDVHLYAFSRRTVFQGGSIRIDHPLPIIAIGSLLKDTEHFSKLLTSGFAEANTGDGESPIRQYARESEYDYESDSDLDEFEELELEEMHTSEGASSSTKGKSKEPEQGGGGSQSLSTGTDKKGEKLHRIFIASFAYRTLKACIFYLYTNKINFLPLASSKGPAERRSGSLTGSETLAPACSPKSMYRLAEAYGINKLQELAYVEIISQLDIQNIIPEAFSSFFSRYPRLREHAVSYLSRNYSNPAIQEALPDLIGRIVAGDMPYAGDVLRSLLGLRVALASTPWVAQPSSIAPPLLTSWAAPLNSSKSPFDAPEAVPTSSWARPVSALETASTVLSGFTRRNYAQPAKEEEDVMVLEAAESAVSVKEKKKAKLKTAKVKASAGY